MNRAARSGVAMAAVGLVAAGGFALPSTRAQLRDAARSAASVFTAGDWSDGSSLPEHLADAARRAACPAMSVTAACPTTPPVTDTPAPSIEEQLADPMAPPAPGSTPPAVPTRPTVTEKEREELPAEGGSCDDDRCVEAAITVVDRFVTVLEDDERAPQDAVATLRGFVDEVAGQEQSQDQSQEQGRDIPLTDAVRDALDRLVESGLAPVLAPRCLITLGELAAQLAEDPAGEVDPEPSASTCPAESTTAPPEPETAPSPSPSAEPQPTASRSEADTDGDGETDTIYDKPGRPYGERDDSKR